MKTRTILFFAALAAGVSLSAQVKTHDYVNTTTLTSVALFNDSTYEYPTQIINYKGKKFQVKAKIAHVKYFGINACNSARLDIYVKPLNIDGLDSVMRDSIAPFGNYSTIISENRLDDVGYGRRIKGSADMYARAFSAWPCKKEDMLKIKYDAKFDFRHPETNKIEFKISQGKWSKADTESKSTNRKDSPYYAFWSYSLHNMKLSSKTKAQDSTITNKKITATMHAISDVPESESAKGNVKWDNPGKVTSFISFSSTKEAGHILHVSNDAVYDYPSTYDNEKETRFYISTTGKKDGEVTMQHSARVRITDTESYNPEDFYKMDFRAYAKCKYHKDLHSGKRDALYYEKATFSCMIHP